MKKFQSLGRSLSKAEQKNVMGGDPPAGNCVWCVAWGGSCGVISSCWYRSGGGDANAICASIYPACPEVGGSWSQCSESCIFN